MPSTVFFSVSQSVHEGRPFQVKMSEMEHEDSLLLSDEERPTESGNGSLGGFGGNGQTTPPKTFVANRVIRGQGVTSSRRY